jgi:hypothetical protein
MKHLQNDFSEFKWPGRLRGKVRIVMIMEMRDARRKME